MSAAGKSEEITGAISGSLALHLLGILRMHEGRYDEAEEAFLRAVKAEPEMAGSYWELGLVYACLGEYREMVDVLKQAVAACSNGVRAYLGECPLGNISANVAVGPKADGDCLPSIVIAMEYLAEGRDTEAAVMLEQALKNQLGHRPLTMTLLALTYLLQGEAVDADSVGVRRMVVTAEGAGL